MSLIPSRPLFNIYDPYELDSLFFPLTYSRLNKKSRNSLLQSSMSIDMKENKNNYMVKVDLPGVEKSTIDISIDNNTLTISCEKSEEVEEKDDKSKYYYSERTYGSQSRSITIPSNVDIDNVTADYVDGVLKINLPKTTKNRNTRTLKIN